MQQDLNNSYLTLQTGGLEVCMYKEKSIPKYSPNSPSRSVLKNTVKYLLTCMNFHNDKHNILADHEIEIACNSIKIN
jgi:hypothetical protein